MKEALQKLTAEFELSVHKANFVKITLSKPQRKSNELVNVYVREVEIRGNSYFQFLYRSVTNDQVKNYTFRESKLELEKLIINKFNAVTLFTLEKDVQISISKKKKVNYSLFQPSIRVKPTKDHDKTKVKRAKKNTYLYHLGITDKEFKVIPKMADKFRQINKYLEIIESQLNAVKLPNQINIVDMGSGKGYLTFALYDYLTNKGYDVTVTGIELRTHLVDYCNEIARKCAYSNLNFVAQPIQAYSDDKIDVLIALHACDTATDDAIYKGIVSKAQLIICAPCCHKQLRKQVKGKEQESPLLKYGIFKERQFEMITDTIRALLLEKEQYKTNVFEFISNEHTRKNIMLVATKSSKTVDTSIIESKISALKSSYAIDSHYLETLL